MHDPIPDFLAGRHGAELELPLSLVEGQLAQLGAALRLNDPQALESAASGLHRALAAAIDHFRHAARSGGVPAPLRQRLATATAQVAAQRESLARATAALDRAIDVLIPGAPPTYSAAGAAARAASSGSLRA
jgi:hypothetical protein